MYFHKTPAIIKWMAPRLIWHKSRLDKTLYLTFDDGPIPEVTDFVLNILNQYQVNATFFCVGENIGRHPEIFKKLITSGHQVGNHTFNHMNGWKSEDEPYIENVNRCQQAMKIAPGSQGRHLFRPPYGRMRGSQIKTLLPVFEIIMWDVLSGDFDHKLPPETCLRKTISVTQNGSIIIFHDSLKAYKNLKFALPRYIDHFIGLGYTFALV